ncbi:MULTISPECIES: hypothetical protein [Mesorhizobium]|uniref:hypothetical protein n=2 Tax=Phyllobacteriaceae TaxID=69277 RepID=UPI0007A95BF7|nr:MULTISPECIES: hypothetical protein [Mesorhizobium]AMX93711.1 hypothetical protein A4R28_11665 [Mesorhizobium ciceri]MDF3208410.1 hypothetical protein [Mesorhizobium sp. LMG15046]MDF3229019.1 hypothetical protein [Mesorhizobium sp. DSM 30133]RUU22135.1 hypothetical protein EOC84_03225 [Mesorhizobium sp. Primo-B]RUU37955.1 hypothetical protein EOC83_16990 [Mesorhizobium sp. Primo-A]
MVIGGLDIATTTGAAFLKDGVFTAETFVYSGAKKKKSILDGADEKLALDANELGKVFDWFDRVVRIWLVTNRIESLAIEEPLRTDFAGRKKAVVDTNSNWAGKSVTYEKKGGISLKTIFKLHGLEAIACRVCAQLNIPVMFVNQATWRLAFLGNGRPPDAKSEAVKMCRKLGIEITSVDAAEGVGVCWWLDRHLNPYSHRRANDLFAEKPLTRAQLQIKEAEKLFKANA